MKMLGNGVYNIGEAARYTGLKRARVREWFRGRTSDPFPRPVFVSDYEVVDGEYAISFLDLVEVFIAGQLREHGVSLQYIRRAHAKLQNDWQTKHPFSKKDIRTDGKELFVCALDGEERQDVYEAISKNKVFESIILPVLERIDYDRATALARKWYLTPLVVIDPAISFGKPIIERAALSTKVLAAAFYANGQDARVVARWYDTLPEYVEAAVEFENRFTA
jgi:uncharacterized protein (DUF433 family)